MTTTLRQTADPGLPLRPVAPTRPPDPGGYRLSPWQRIVSLLEGFIRWVPWLLYLLFVLSLLGLAYMELEAEGLRLTLPTLGKKLHKLNVPFLQGLARYRETNRIDLAVCVALLLELATFWAWDTFLKHYLYAHPPVQGRFNAEKFQRLTCSLALGVISFDCYLFYRGTQALMWGSSEFSLTAVVTTLGWAILIVIASVISIQLQPVRREE